jgi:hypothetical protein
MASESVADQHSWLTVCSILSLGVEDPLQPFQANLGISIPGFGARILPPRRLKCGPITLMGGGRPYDHRCKRPTVPAYTLYSSNSGPL